MRFLFVLILVGIILYLSWIPNPSLQLVGFMPSWLARWADEQANEDLRTGVPFVLLGLFAGLVRYQRTDQIFRWLLLWGLLTGLVVLAEVGQLWLPKRNFSWADIGWGTVGSLVGLALAAIAQSQRQR